MVTIGGGERVTVGEGERVTIGGGDLRKGRAN